MRDACTMRDACDTRDACTIHSHPLVSDTVFCNEVSDAHQVLNLIDGRFSAASDNASLNFYNPATAQKIGSLPHSTQHDVDRAVLAAAREFPAWSHCAPAFRAQKLNALAELIERDLDDFALAESVNTGKPLQLARTVDIPRAIANLRFFAQLILQPTAQRFVSPDFISDVHRRALGVAACISPWNLPLYLFTWKIAPALAAGCTVVAKPSEVTPLTAWMLAQRSIEADFAPGVLNIVHGSGAGCGAAMVAHAQVACITFTGGTATGETIARSAATTCKRVALELGGKNAALVFADACTHANIDATLQGVVRAAFTNQGQVCHCASRILIERSAWDEVVPALVKRTRQLHMGDPLLSSTHMGALISPQHRGKVHAAVEQAVRDGAIVLCGGALPTPNDLPEHLQNGCFYPATLLANLPQSCPANQEEIFGPVATLTPFDSQAHAIALANDTRFGLSATIWSGDAAHAQQIAKQLHCGTVWINAWMLRDLRVPIGGFGASGIGREGGVEALHFFAEPITIVHPTPSMEPAQ